jgi:hypothetical protein
MSFSVIAAPHLLQYLLTSLQLLTQIDELVKEIVQFMLTIHLNDMFHRPNH